VTCKQFDQVVLPGIGVVGLLLMLSETVPAYRSAMLWSAATLGVFIVGIQFVHAVYDHGDKTG
jgi:hypothetical protein